MFLTGIHHVTAITANARAHLRFYRETLGLRLVKKTVDPEDVSAYQLFYGDGKATPGSGLTVLDRPMAREGRGTSSVVCTALRVKEEAALEYWARRLSDAGIVHGGIETRDERHQLLFEDDEGQRLALVDDGGRGGGAPWTRSPVPPDMQIRGLGPVTVSVPDLAPTAHFLSTVLGLRAARSYASEDGRAVHVFEMGAGGPGAELHVKVEPGVAPAAEGVGGVHHVALRVPSFDEHDAWEARLRAMGVAHSGRVDRHYFRALYVRVPGGPLFGLATDGPGFTADEAEERLGERLALPPFLEPRRKQIEAGLKGL